MVIAVVEFINWSKGGNANLIVVLEGGDGLVAKVSMMTMIVEIGNDNYWNGGGEAAVTGGYVRIIVGD